MCCNDYRNSIHEYASGKLSELEMHSVAKHLKTCDKCRRELDEIRELKAVMSNSFHGQLTAPLDMKSNIMASINLNKYKKVYKNAWGEVANWGMSLVAAGLILLFVNMAPVNNVELTHNEWANTRESIREKLQQPFSSINHGLDSFTRKITELDGISGRIERQKKGGN